ncbi:MAG: D-tyrosyl-tRNA(Tyr) deacylase [Methanomicrobiaceae archaeon]|nr:D-tyrosyl-tRNA(Tyr) deacylase [Methanomicrobiaceae archaeon]MDD5420197.1 D-aminoacyl-tRNA deacylase [Methanomicrobiaceae archaeon]
MHIAIVSSRQDPGGVNIRRHLLERLARRPGDWPLLQAHHLEFLEVEGRLIYEDRIDEKTDADLILFISRHASSHPVPALTVHVTGNYGPAELGGEARTLTPAAPELMHAVLNNLAHRAPDGYRVSYEVTHHGPTGLAVPSLFAEIGSTPREWEDPAAGRAVAESILSAEPDHTINLIGFGGTHYAVRQTAISLRSRAAFGHIAPGRALPLLDPGIVRMMRDQTRAVAAYIDRKALTKAEIAAVEDLIGQAGLEPLTEGEILAIGDLDWESYLLCRRAAGEAAPGAALHLHALAGKVTPKAFAVPGDLLEEVLKTDKTGFFAGIRDLPLAHLSMGSNEVLPVFLADAREVSRLVNVLITLCVKLLLIHEDIVVRGDCLVIRRARFDPRKARELGIPAGPLFGRLAGGGEVEIGGRRITPDMVQTSHEREIHIPGLERYT